ncbi:MAG: lamin tail domain-containing protein [Bacteroidales bacterium]|nr:lamin tail domain-containing protein [Bacteroidales bacterium]
MTITASGNPTPTYQWYSNTSKSNSNGTAISGATGASYTPSTATAGTFYYYCVATNSEGSASSNVATITVNPVTTYTVQWKVGGNVYTTGNPTTSVASGSKVSTLPTAPAGNAIGSCANTFMGWSTNDLGSGTGQGDPGDLFTTESPVITGNATYYAVFATKNTTGGGAGEQLIETVGFESSEGYTSSTTYNNSNYTTGASGSKWTINYGAFSTSSAIVGSQSAQFRVYNAGNYGQLRNTVAYAIDITKVVFNARVSNTNSSIKVSYSADGTSWTDIETVSFSGTTMVEHTSTISVSGARYIKFTAAGSKPYSGNYQIYIDAIKVYANGGGSTTTYTDYVTQCDNDCDAPGTPLSITAEETLNLNESSEASTTLSTTGGNGGTVNYTVSPSATISGNTITFNATGTYTVTATQEKNGNTCAQNTTVQITVKATPVITLVADAPIKLIADCGQKATATVQVTAYNCGTNDVTITSSNPRVTVSPASFTPADGKVNGTVTLSYTASTGGDSENYSAEISARCDNTAGQNTISVTATKGGCTPSVLTFMDRGSQYKQINSHYAGQTLPANEVPDPTGVCTQPVEYIFDGWATATVDNGATSYEKVTFPYEINGDQTFYAVYRYAEGGDKEVIFDASDISNLTEIGTLSWKENTSGVTLTLSAGQRYTSGTPNTFTVTKGNTNYFEVSSSSDIKKVVVEVSEANYTVNTSTKDDYVEVSTKDANLIQTLTVTTPKKSVKGYALSGYQIRMKKITVTCGNVLYTSLPACGPYVQIVGSKELYVTSGNVGGRSTVQAQDTIRFTSGSLAGSGANAPKIKVPAADITINGTPTSIVGVEFKDSICTKNVDGTYSITGGIVVRYTPTDVNRKEDIKVKLRAEYNTGKNVVLDSFVVHARSLPEKFVIAAKQGDKWYALPADMSGSSTYAGNGQLVVDNTANPTKANITPCNTIYKFDGQKQGGDLRYVRFVGLGGKYLWAATTGNTGIKNDAKDPAAADAPYNWLLTSADNVTYTFANQNTDRTLRLSGTNFGMYTSGVNELRILPIVEKDTCAYNAAPQNIKLLSRTSTTLTLAWSAVPGAERYQFSRNGGTDWYPCDGIADMAHPEYEFTKLSASTEYTIVLRAVHGNAAKICSDTAQITVTTAACDKVPEISGTISDVSSCGTLTLTATGVTATTESDTYCPVTQYGFQYTQDPTWAKYEQTEHSNAPTGTIEDNVTVSRGGTYYVRLYAINGVGTGYSTQKEITVSGLANLQIITAGDATTAPMISGKATLRIGAVSDSPSPITWQVFDGSNAQQTAIADGITNNGVFSTTAFGVYRVVAKQAANADPTYCADSATIYIEVRLPNHYGYVTNCAVLNNNNLEVINVSSSEITFGIDDADVVQIEIVKENTGNTSTGGGGQAEGLFFSKYYEATGNVKLVAVFNGTGQDIDVTNYTIKYGKTSWEQYYIKLGNFTNTKNIIAAGEEVILYTTGATNQDTDIMDCVNLNYPDGPWKQVTAQNSGGSGLLSFAGDKTIALFNNTELVDVIGAVTDGGVPTNAGVVPTASQVDPSGISWADNKGWYCASGQSIKDGSVIGTSTNRCLLIRKNTVVSGANAVSSNKSTFTTLCDEWVGEHVPDTATDNGVQASCDNFAYVGSFDYAEYFQRYEPVTGKIDLVDLVDNHDGSWSLPTSSFEGTAWDGKNFHDLACTSVKINGYQKIGLKDSLITALNYKVPIIVDRTTTTEDADLFGFAGEGRLICPECDVVIRDNEKLSVVPAGYNNIRNMWVYSGAALNIQDGKTYNMGKLTIESENNEVGYALIKGTLNAQDGISHTKRIDANAWYDFSLPYNCKVSDIVRTNGKTLGTYGTDWIIKYYDGQKRAISGTPNGAAPTNWAVVPADGILEAGVGYIVALGGIHNANPNYKVRFVLPNRSTQPYVESVTSSVKKGVKGYTGPKAEELPCHKGWNYLGNPYVSRFDGDKQNPSWQTYTGLLLNGFYTDLLTGNSYAEYSDIYVAVDMGEGGATNWVQTKASEALLSPFRAFMIQAVSDGDVDFNKEARNLPQGQAPSVRSVNTERETVSAVRLNIDHDTYGTGSADIMLHSLYTDKYDLGYDMVRMFNSRPAAQPFTLNSTADYLLYNAANRDLAETADIPVGIRTLAAGTYTFSLAPLTGTDRYAAIYLIDRDENDLKFDLLQGNYTTMLARETNTSRFALRFEKGAQLPTDIDNDAIQSPIIYRDQTDIVIDNLPTDATVRVVDAIGRTLYMQQADAQIVRFHAPARGAYIIQVMTQQGNFSIKTIL